jgi:hypothetical protein
MEDVRKAIKRNRTINWSREIDELAVRLAAEGGYIQTEGGVSKYLEDLVFAYAKEQGVASFKTPLAEIEKRLAALEKKNRKKV